MGELSITMRAILLGEPAPQAALAAAARIGVRLDPAAEVPVVVTSRSRVGVGVGPRASRNLVACESLHRRYIAVT